MYRFLTPDDAVALARADGDSCQFHLHPLCGGMLIDRGWEMLHLYAEQVLPRLS